MLQFGQRSVMRFCFDRVYFSGRYLDNPDEFEAKISGNGELQKLEDELRESCSAFLHRFFLLLSDIAMYHEELYKHVLNLQVDWF